MKVEAEVISKETVKPSSPTPSHLRRYTLSFLDQISPPIYMPLLLFFSSSSSGGGGGGAKLAGLKRSLSEALTRFYPLAGRVRGNDFIDCDDAGVSFTTARANNRCLHEFLRDDPAVAELDELLPCEPDDDDAGGGHGSALLVRATVFDCGGMVIGLCFSHKAGDASSLVMFLRTWTDIATAAVAVADHEGDRYIPTPSPRFESAELFPPKSLSGFKSRTGIIKESNVTKRFVFDAPTIESLRKKSSIQQNQQLQRRPTRVEALSAFIWTRFMTATAAHDELEEKLYMVQHTVNIRRRMDPPLPDNSFGNYYRIAVATLSSAAAKNSLTAENDEEGLNGLVGEMREAIGKIDGEYVRRVREGDEHLKFVKERAERATKGKLESFTFSSLCRMPWYETDFGWGKPIWVASAGMPFRNLVSFFDSRSGDGIEAWINLKEEDMVKLEGDEEFMSMVSSPP